MTTTPRDSGVYIRHGVVGILNGITTLFDPRRAFVPVGQDWPAGAVPGLPGGAVLLTEAEVDALEAVDLTPQARRFLAARHLAAIRGVSEVCDDDPDPAMRGAVYLWAETYAAERADRCAAFFGLTGPEVQPGNATGTWRTYRLPAG